MKILIIFPHQLFPLDYYKSIADENTHIFIVECSYFFTRFPFHKLKLAYHRATMQYYYDDLLKYYDNVKYIEYDKSDAFFDNINKYKPKLISLYDPIEKELQKIIKKISKQYTIEIYESPYFLNSHQENININNELSSIRHDLFYKHQRIKYNLLLKDNKPIFDKWSFDKDNRLKFPKDQEEPEILKMKKNKYIEESILYINKNFDKNYGELTEFIYPITRKLALKWLEHFIENKLEKFGKYEDAIGKNINFGYHSVLSPMLNIGLIIPQDIINIIKKQHITKTNIATIEGFIRQVIGWREYSYFIYDMYESYLSKNHFYTKNKNKIPKKIWNADTTIPYVDTIINKVNKYAYCHHIERLMGMSNFMNMINIHPREIYKWFMIMFIDAYDVFMFPNVYGMALFGFVNKKQHMMTKPYLSSSNYILKMSDHKKGDWTEIIDALYYEMIKDNAIEYRKIYSLSPAVMRYNKFTKKQKDEYHKIKKDFIKLIF